MPAFSTRSLLASTAFGAALLLCIADEPILRPCRADALSPYDPGAAAGAPDTEILQLAVHDESRKRDIPLHVVLPAPAAHPAPVVLFSHGLGGTAQTSEFLGIHWAARGYAVVFPQHPGSDDAIWKDLPVQQQFAAVARAASPENAQERVRDIYAVLDQLERWTLQPGHPLAARLDLTRLGMSGHSFGALTTQALSGQADSVGDQSQNDRRIRAAIVMSPAIPAQGDVRAAFAAVGIPWLVLTGSKDHAPLGHMPPEARRDVFNHLPPNIDHYELVLGGAHHFAFTSHPLPDEVPPRNPHHHKTILRVTTAFWDAYLGDDPAARLWLQGPDIRASLDPADRWRIGMAQADEQHSRR